MHYWAIVHHDEGSAYGVSFPDVPDCFAAADDEQNVMSNAISALDDYFCEGGAYPAPRGLEAVRKEFDADLREGAYLIQVPLIARPSKSVRVNISLDQGTLEAIDEAAARLQLNRSAFITQAAHAEILRRKAA